LGIIKARLGVLLVARKALAHRFANVTLRVAASTHTDLNCFSEREVIVALDAFQLARALRYQARRSQVVGDEPEYLAVECAAAFRIGRLGEKFFNTVWRPLGVPRASKEFRYRLRPACSAMFLVSLIFTQRDRFVVLGALKVRDETLILCYL
jgi:hypothetical protein